MIDAVVREHDHAGGGIDASVERTQHLVDGARVTFHRGLVLHVPHDEVEGVRAGYHHWGNGRRVIGAFVVVDRDQSIHERTRGDQGHVAERSAAYLLLAGEPF